MRRTVDAYLQLPSRRFFSALELHAVAIGSIAAVVLLIGWGFGVRPLQSLAPGFPTMKPSTAASFMALSLGCLLTLRGKGRRLDFAAASLGLAVPLFMGLLTIYDGAWVPSHEWQRLPSDATRICLSMAGAAITVIALAPGARGVAGILALLGVTPALYRFVVLLLFRGAPSEPSPLDTMALHTAALTVWFMTVCVLMHPRLGFGAAIMEASLRGRVLRRALPAMILVPAAASALSLGGAGAFGWTEEPLFALTATLSGGLGVMLIWWISKLLDQWQREANEHATRLVRANETLEQYASSAAHDLKAPARHVMLYSELVQEAIGRGDLETAMRHVRNIHDSAAELPAMVEGLLEFSRSGDARINLGEVSLSELVQAASALESAELASANARVLVEREAQLVCDAQLMTALFQNLIGNSLKNRRIDRPLQIRIDAARNADIWEVSVEDNGVGFSPDFAGIAFNPLARGVISAGGAGIGLATCRTIIQGHGGEIRVDPTYRDGARIEFTLPVKAGPGPSLEDTSG
ncbi:MAG: hypothetical protein GC155_09990 [Alphaproteobacteria bacterium]|nr:hypothetical protein [Alphaproteobacteria bacterium]